MSLYKGYPNKDKYIEYLEKMVFSNVVSLAKDIFVKKYNDLDPEDCLHEAEEFYKALEGEFKNE